jgi:hypothetical protein
MRSSAASSSIVKRGQSAENEQQAPQLRQSAVFSSNMLHIAPQYRPSKRQAGWQNLSAFTGAVSNGQGATAIIVNAKNRCLPRSRYSGIGTQSRSRPPGVVARLVHPDGTSSVHTRKLDRLLGPNICVSGTSAASRPKATRMRPWRGVLLRGSKTCQRPPR